MGYCGMCTVIMDGRPVMSCITLAVCCEGQDIETIEGLQDPVTKELHPIQVAFKENFGTQCGYCAPGAIMSAKALLDKNPSPTLAEAMEAESAVLCRCSNFTAIFESILAV